MPSGKLSLFCDPHAPAHPHRVVLYLMRFSVERAAAQAGVNVSGMFLMSNSDDLRFLTGLIEANKVKTVRRGRGGGS